jgi:hypothetical protein
VSYCRSVAASSAASISNQYSTSANALYRIWLRGTLGEVPVFLCLFPELVCLDAMAESPITPVNG